MAEPTEKAIRRVGLVADHFARFRAQNVDNSGLTKEALPLKEGRGAVFTMPGRWGAKDKTPAAQYKEEKAMDEKVGRQR